jgi:hypothetical protein
LHDQLLPTSVPIATAALLAGLSRDSFRERVLETHLIRLDQDHRVPLTQLAAYLGRPIDLEDLLEADRRRDPARASQRRYRREQCV